MLRQIYSSRIKTQHWGMFELGPGTSDSLVGGHMKMQTTKDGVHNCCGRWELEVRRFPCDA